MNRTAPLSREGQIDFAFHPGGKIYLLASKNYLEQMPARGRA